jgi:hypothetical protein
MSLNKILQTNQSIKDIQEIIDENKESLSNDIYLKICDKMKTIYDNSDISFIEKIYNFTYVKTTVDIVPYIDGTIEYKMKNKILNQIAFYKGSIDDLEKIIKPCNCCYLDNYVFHKNDNGLTELIEAFPKIKKIIEKDENEDEDEDEAQVKININLEYNDIIIVNFRKIEMEELSTLDRPPMVVDEDEE